MQARLILALALSSAFLAACSSSSNSPRAVPANPPTNDQGTPVTGVITARFDPATGVIPLPNNLLFSGTRDLTLNPPVANPNNFADPTVAISALDGWSTVAPATIQFSTAPRASSLTAGGSIRVFQVALNSFAGPVSTVTRELIGGQEFVVAVVPSDTTGRTVAIIPTVPRAQLTSYMVVVTDAVEDAAGNDATPDTTYFLATRTSPLCVNGASTDPLIPTANACALEPLRLLTNSQLAAAASRGINRNDVVLSFVFTTQSITPVLQAVRASTTARSTTLAATPFNIGIVPGLPPIADIYVGVTELRYFLTAPSAANPIAPLNTFWRATPGNYLPPFSQSGLDPTSFNLTFANPNPVPTATQRVPVVLTVPNANSGRMRPAAGWPIVIYNHGITRSRGDAILVSAALASQGFAVIAIDQPLHGVGPTGLFNELYIERTPFGAIASERTFDVDYVNNTTGAAGPDGVIDASGTHYINLASLLTSRDNLRQSVADLFQLAANIPTMSYDADPGADFDASRIQFVGMSLGSITGVPFLALEPTVNVGLLNVPGGGIAQLLNGSATFGPRIRAGLAAAGLQAGTPDFDRFLGAAQQVVDSVDPINYGFASTTDKLLAQLVVGNGSTVPPDQVVPVAVPGAPLSGGEALARILGLQTITATTQNANGIRGVIRFTAGDHGSLINPAASAAATTEMQTQMASFEASAGNAVVVTNTSVIRTQ